MYIYICIYIHTYIYVYALGSRIDQTSIIKVSNCYFTNFCKNVWEQT